MHPDSYMRHDQMGFINPDPYAASMNLAVPVGMFMQPPLMQQAFNGMPPMQGNFKQFSIPHDF